MRRFRLKPLRLTLALLIGSLSFAGVAYAASLGVSSRQLHAWGQTLTRGTCASSSMTEDDTFVQQSKASTTAAGSATLSITGGTTGQNYAFVRFDLSGCSLPTTAGADSSTLTIVVTTASTHTISLFPVSTSWSSSTLTWNGLSGLNIGSTATTSFTGTAGSHTLTVTADVDAAIKAGALWGWELRDTTGGPAATTKIGGFANGTPGNRPALTISYEK